MTTAATSRTLLAMAAGTSGTELARDGEESRLGPIPKIEQANLDALLTNLRDGVPLTTSGTLAGIPHRTLMRWLAKGRVDGAADPYRTFTVQVELAIADWKASRIRSVDKAAEKEWKAGAWLLERRFPDEFGDPRRGDVNVQVNLLQSAEWDDLQARLLAVLAPYPEALAAVGAELGGVGGEVIEGRAELAP